MNAERRVREMANRGRQPELDGGDVVHFSTGDMFGKHFYQLNATGHRERGGERRSSCTLPSYEEPQSPVVFIAETTCICLKFDLHDFNERINHALASMLILAPSIPLRALALPPAGRTTAGVASIAQYLRRLHFFRHFLDGPMEAISKIVTLRHVPRGGTFHRRSTQCNELGVVVQGQLSVMPSPGGNGVMSVGEGLDIDYQEAAARGLFVPTSTLHAMVDTQMCVISLTDWAACVKWDPVMQDSIAFQTTLEQPVHLRSKSNLTKVVAQLEHIRFMQQLPADKRAQVVERLEYREIPAATLIYSQGEPIDRLFIILAGSVEIRRRPENDLRAGGTRGGGGRGRVSRLRSRVKRDVGTAAYDDLTDEEVVERFGAIEGNFCVGDAFGGKTAAAGGQRAETAIAFEAVTVLCLSAEAYDNLIKPLERTLLFQSSSTLRDIVWLFGADSNDAGHSKRTTAETCGATDLIFKLIRPLEVFRGVPEAALRELAPTMALRQLKRGEAIVSSGARVTMFHVLAQGRLQVTRSQPSCADAVSPAATRTTQPSFATSAVAGGATAAGIIEQESLSDGPEYAAEGSSLGEVPFLQSALSLSTIKACSDGGAYILTVTRNVYNDVYRKYSLVAQRVDIVHRCTLFSTLTGGDVEQLFSASEIVSYPARTDITQAMPGASRCVFLVLQGECRVSSQPDGGGEIQLGLLGPRQTFNEACVANVTRTRTTSSDIGSGNISGGNSGDGGGGGAGGSGVNASPTRAAAPAEESGRGEEKLVTTRTTQVLVIRGTVLRGLFGRAFVEHVSQMTAQKVDWRNKHREIVQTSSARHKGTTTAPTATATPSAPDRRHSPRATAATDPASATVAPTRPCAWSDMGVGATGHRQRLPRLTDISTLAASYRVETVGRARLRDNVPRSPVRSHREMARSAGNPFAASASSSWGSGDGRHAARIPHRPSRPSAAVSGSSSPRSQYQELAAAFNETRRRRRLRHPSLHPKRGANTIPEIMAPGQRLVSGMHNKHAVLITNR